MTDLAAAVEAVRARHVWAERIPKEKWTEQLMQDQLEAAHLDRATLLRAYEDVVARWKAQRDALKVTWEAKENENATLRAQHAALVPVLDAALAWEAAWTEDFETCGAERRELVKAIRAYRAAKETP
ncbi:MAG TPA: hypothetical protein VL563_01095 [Gemmatimonadales bacterium]|jgi:hypothetical protein|nr:hypothetical protein [Gemmatimonadales bacterium]